MASMTTRGIVVFSGGSAANNLVDVFDSVRQSKNCPLSYIIPISDNGGSSSELIRVFGGPGIGDVRSRLVRLIPSNPPSPERSAISTLFNHRLSSTSPSDAAQEFHTIVSGTSPLWFSIPPSKKELIRSFLNVLNLEILKRSRPPTSTFDFTSASVGNLFLTAARLFTGSFESAIYLLSSICGISDEIVRVVPAINSNFTHHIAAGLANGDVIVGQNSISHPSVSTALENPTATATHSHHSSTSGIAMTDEDATLPGSLATLRKSQIAFTKTQSDSLPARIQRIWYINPYGQEMHPPPPANPRVIDAIHSSQALIYSIGSLYTSIIPNLILRGVGQAIHNSPTRHKILILNGSIDRETSGPASHPFTAFDFVDAIARAGEQSRGQQAHAHAPRQRLLGETRSETDLAHTPQLTSRVNDKNDHLNDDEGVRYDKYVTHVIHLSGPGTPAVNREELAACGIECVRLYGRKIEDGSGGARGVRYDNSALVGAIEAILGRKGDAMGLKSRRNTLDA